MDKDTYNLKRESELEQFSGNLNEQAEYRKPLENRIREQLRHIRSRISNTEKTRFYKENNEFREMVSNLKEYIKVGSRAIAEDPFDKNDNIYAEKLSDMTYEQLLAYNAKLKEWDMLASRKGFEQIMEKRIKGIADYVYQEGDYSIAKGDKGFAILHGGKMYKMSYSDISEFWKKFGKLYRESNLKDLRNYEDEGVSYIFELYYDDGIEDVETLKKIVNAKYDEEQAEKIEMLRNVQDDLDKLMPTPRRH